MKKILILFLCILNLFILNGCTMDNTPTKKVENFLNSYRNLDEKVITQMNEIVNDDILMDEVQREKYKNILKKQYQDLIYKIKDEKIDGDNALVTVEIEVYDFYKVTKDSDNFYQENQDKFKDENGNITQSKFIDYRLQKLKENKEKVKYTIDFNLRKVDNIWVLEEITDSIRQKIHGLYAY